VRKEGDEGGGEEIMVARRWRFVVDVPFVEGSWESRPSLRRRIRSVEVLGVEKKPPDWESQKREICFSISG